MDDTSARPEEGPAPHPLDAIVEAWWDAQFPGSPVARVTEAWNHAYAAKEELKRRLKKGA